MEANSMRQINQYTKEDILIAHALREDEDGMKPLDGYIARAKRFRDVLHAAGYGIFLKEHLTTRALRPIIHA